MKTEQAGFEPCSVHHAELPLTDLCERFSQLLQLLRRDLRAGGHVGNLKLTERRTVLNEVRTCRR